MSNLEFGDLHGILVIQEAELDFLAGNPDQQRTGIAVRRRT